jgi:hypothetical protein
MAEDADIDEATDVGSENDYPTKKSSSSNKSNGKETKMAEKNNSAGVNGDGALGTDERDVKKPKLDPKDPLRPRRKKARRACFACQRAHLTCGKFSSSSAISIPCTRDVC